MAPSCVDSQFSSECDEDCAACWSLRPCWLPTQWRVWKRKIEGQEQTRLAVRLYRLISFMPRYKRRTGRGRLRGIYITIFLRIILHVCMCPTKNTKPSNNIPLSAETVPLVPLWVSLSYSSIVKQHPTHCNFNRSSSKTPNRASISSKISLISQLSWPVTRA
jgi:hypothetical protein